MLSTEIKKTGHPTLINFFLQLKTGCCWTIFSHSCIEMKEEPKKIVEEINIRSKF